MFATGASLPSEKVINAVRNNNFSVHQQGQIEFFYLRGGFNFDELPLFDKILMALLKKKIMFEQRRGKKLAADELGMLALYDKPTNFTKRENIQEIIQLLKR